MKPSLVVLLVAAITCLCQAAEVTALHKLTGAELETRFASDVKQIQVERQGLRGVIAFMDTRADIFPRERVRESRLLRREEKEVAWNTWQRFMDYIMTINAIEDYHSEFYRLSGSGRVKALEIGTAAMLARYRAALEFIARTEENPELDKVLNDPVPELGLPGDTYARLKFKNLNLAMATQFSAREILLKTFPGWRQPALEQGVGEDSEYLWNAGKGGRASLTAKNALKIIQTKAQAGWLPVQTGVSEWMGHTKVYRVNKPLISLKQIRECQARLLPGDILLERREWYLSNIGLPGFWSHAALYIGTPAERRAYFDDEQTKHWIRGQESLATDVEELLQARYAEAYHGMLAHRDPPGYAEQGDRPNDPVRIIEAISEGVSFHSLEHCAACDSLVVLRPRLSKQEKAQALLRAFAYAGRPYDFDFDFSTDAKLVCTELVYKCYEPSADCKGLKFSTVEMLGRKVTPANEFARQFDAQFGTAEQQTEMVLFLDGQERQQKALESNVEEFRQSWKRPKWHVLVQKDTR